jgi:hypothetical protein
MGIEINQMVINIVEMGFLGCKYELSTVRQTASVYFSSILAAYLAGLDQTTQDSN